MSYKLLNAEDAFAEIARLEREKEEGVVVNIAEKLWAGCAQDDAYREEVRAKYGMPVFHSGYRSGMVDVVFPGDLCVCVVEKARSGVGDRLFQAAQSYLRERGIPALADGSDFLLVDVEARQVYKLGSYGEVPTESVMWETTVHISIHADRELIEAFRVEPPEMARAGLDKYGVTAEELWEAILSDITEGVIKWP